MAQNEIHGLEARATVEWYEGSQATWFGGGLVFPQAVEDYVRRVFG